MAELKKVGNGFLTNGRILYRVSPATGKIVDVGDYDESYDYTSNAASTWAGQLDIEI